MSGEQTYTSRRLDVSVMGTVHVQVCDGCGVVVWNTEQHDRYHGKTRSTV